MKGKLLVILGPTATGKTDLALQLARKFQGELVSADSRQVYKGLDVGTGKLPSKISNVIKMDKNWIINGIKIWLYDVVSPKKQYSVANYVKDAEKMITDIVERNKLPIIVGGTGLYIKALLEGLPNLSFPVDKNLRKNLEKLSLEHLQKKLQRLSLKKWEVINNSDRQNPRRLVRQIELSLTSNGNSKGLFRGGLSFNFDVFKIGLTAPRNILYKLVDKRVLARIDQGMIEEAKRLYRAELSLQRMKSLGLEYGVLADYLSEKIKTKEELIKIMQGKIHSFVRRQQTWFKKDQDIVWFDVADQNFMDQVENKIYTWYYSS